LSSSIDFSAGQLAAARAIAWHQDGKALLTLEGARNWVDHFGLVLFAPRSAQLGAPAPSFIEATLGIGNEAPTAAESATARSLAARLVAEGSALPLNLLGSAGDQPDFLASAKVFSYVFTMRGDKTWKQAPSSSEGAKVSPLAVRVWEVLGEKGALTASELVSELGREVTEAAITRALNELWSQLRVIPQHQQDDAPALWELTSKRFAKAIKAGTNAGQPTAMSALLSLYLSQAVGATEEEVAGFLSPLTARSRVREVLNALVSGRQLETTVVDGKTLLHVSGTLPDFPAIAKPEGEAEEIVKAPKVGTGRIAKFADTAERKPRMDFKGKPAFGAAKRESSAGPRGIRPGGPRPSRPAGARPDTERRPFKRAEDSKPSFTKPWEEDKRPRPEAPESEAPRERKPYADKPSYGPKKTFGERKSYGDKPSFAKDRKPYGERTYGGSNSTPRKTFADKPSFGERKPYSPRSDSGPRKTYGDRPSFSDRPARPRRDEGSSEGFTPRERPSYPPRAGGERKSFGAKPSFGGKPAFGARKPFGERKSFGDRPPRREGGSEGFTPRERPSYPPRDGARSFERKPFTPREGGDDRPRRSFGDKPGGFKPRSFDKPRSFGDKPAYGPKKTFGDRPSYGAAGSGPRKTYGDRPKPSYGGGEGRPSFDRPARPGGFGAKPSFGSKPAYGAKPRFGAGKPAGKFGAKPARPYAKRTDSAAPIRRKPETEE
jgi:23S rRNA pseudouridine2605 synthase